MVTGRGAGTAFRKNLQFDQSLRRLTFQLNYTQVPRRLQRNISRRALTLGRAATFPGYTVKCRYGADGGKGWRGKGLPGSVCTFNDLGRTGFVRTRDYLASL